MVAVLAVLAGQTHDQTTILILKFGTWMPRFLEDQFSSLFHAIKSNDAEGMEVMCVQLGAAKQKEAWVFGQPRVPQASHILKTCTVSFSIELT